MVEVEGRKDSLEKELATKDSYIRELEDIIVEKVGSSRQYFHSILQCCGSGMFILFIPDRKTATKERGEK